MSKQYFILVFTLIIGQLKAQETWTLERCIMQAQQNSRVVKQSQVGVQGAKLNDKENRLSRYPTLNASSNLGFNAGRSVNPSTYQFETQTTRFNSINVSGSTTVYNGGRINNRIKQGEADIEAAQADLSQSVQSISLQVAQAYLQILMYEEQLETAKKRLSTTQSQLERTLKQISAGQLPPAAQYDIRAQAASDEQRIVAVQNNVDISYLTLKNLMEVSPETNIKIERPSIVIPNDANPEGFMFKAIYNQAIGNQPIIHADEARIKSAEYGVSVAKANLYPSVFLNYGLSSNFSSSIQDNTKPQGTAQLVYGPNLPVKIDNKNSLLSIGSTTGITYPTKAYFKQLQENFGQGVVLGVQIPIFDGLSRQIGVQRQQLNVEYQKIYLERDKQQLKTDVQNAIASARAAKKQYEAAQKSYEAYKIAYENTDKRFQLGSANAFEFTQAKNNMDSAERDLVVAKYDYLFKLKIVEFYEGKKLVLK